MDYREGEDPLARGRRWVFRVSLLPPRSGYPNARAHPQQRARDASEYRAEVTRALLAQDRPDAPLARALISAGGFFCRRRPRPPNPESLRYDSNEMRPRDPWNFASGIKSLIDALQPERHDGSGHHYGAGIIAGDDYRRSEIGRIWIRDVEGFDAEGVMLIVTELL